MTNPHNRIVLENPEHLQATIQAMARSEQLDRFARTFMRLMDLMSRYLAEDTAPDTMRIARLWPNTYQDNDFFWSIMEEPTDGSAPSQKCLLAGGLHRHAHDGTWGVHT